MRHYFFYLMSSRSRALYSAITNSIHYRVSQHRRGEVAFTAKYRITRLVHVEVFSDVRDAIAREKQVKGWRRSKKIALIESSNPDWRDLAADWPLVPLRRTREQQLPPPSPRRFARGSGSG
jgi:putative endonuclease